MTAFRTTLHRLTWSKDRGLVPQRQARKVSQEDQISPLVWLLLGASGSGVEMRMLAEPVIAGAVPSRMRAIPGLWAACFEATVVQLTSSHFVLETGKLGEVMVRFLLRWPATASNSPRGTLEDSFHHSSWPLPIKNQYWRKVKF